MPVTVFQRFANDWKFVFGTGVYSITNLVTRKRYIGSSAVSFVCRWKQHLAALLANKHPNRHLQSSWKRHGAASFVFEVLEWCHPELCLAREQYYIDLYEPYLRCNGYNLTRSATSVRGLVFSAESRKRVSDKLRGRKFSELHKQKIATANLKINLRPETLSLRAKGHKRWRETEQGRKCVREVVRRMRAGITTESYKKQAAAIRGRKQSAEVVEKRAAKMRGRKLSDSHREKLALAKMGRRLSEAHKDSLKRGWRGRKEKGFLPPNTTGYRASRELKNRLSAIQKANWVKRRANVLSTT
jgi:group I intron endonuclease